MIKIPVVARFFTPLQTGFGAYPTLLYKGYNFFWGGGGKACGGVALTTDLHAAPRLKKERNNTSATCRDFMACSIGNFTFYDMIILRRIRYKMGRACSM
jgi:hypothetical protein